MKIQLFPLLQEKNLKTDQRSPSPKGPFLMDNSWTHEEMWKQAHSQDASTWGFRFACSNLGCFASRDNIHRSPPGKCSRLRLKRHSHMATHGLHGFPSTAASPSPPTFCLWKNQTQVSGDPPELRGETVPTSMLGDAIHLEMFGSKVKQRYL